MLQDEDEDEAWPTGRQRAAMPTRSQRGLWLSPNSRAETETRVDAADSIVNQNVGLG